MRARLRSFVLIISAYFDIIVNSQFSCRTNVVRALASYQFNLRSECQMVYGICFGISLCFEQWSKWRERCEAQLMSEYHCIVRRLERGGNYPRLIRLRTRDTIAQWKLCCVMVNPLKHLSLSFVLYLRNSLVQMMCLLGIFIVCCFIITIRIKAFRLCVCVCCLMIFIPFEL